MVVFERILILLIFVAAGYILAKFKFVNSSQTDILSKLILYIFLPGSIFTTFAMNFDKEYIFANYMLVVWSVVILLVLLVATHFVAKLFTKKKYDRCIYEYCMAIPNFGFIGYPLAQALMGTAGLLDFMTFSVPVSFYAYTIAFGKLTKRGFSLKGLLNSTMICIAISMLIGITGFTVPKVVSDIFTSANACMGPVGMLMTGIIMSEFDVKAVFLNKKLYLVLFIRLILIPLLIGFLLKGICTERIIMIVVLFYSLPCGLNSVIYPKLVNENCEIGVGLSMLSTILSLVSIPIVCAMYF